MISWFYALIFGIVFLVLWVGLKNIFVPGIFLLFMLAQWGHLLPPGYVYDAAQIVLIFMVASLLYRAFAPKNIN